MCSRCTRWRRWWRATRRSSPKEISFPDTWLASYFIYFILYFILKFIYLLLSLSDYCSLIVNNFLVRWLCLLCVIIDSMCFFQLSAFNTSTFLQVSIFHIRIQYFLFRFPSSTHSTRTIPRRMWWWWAMIRISWPIWLLRWVIDFFLYLFFHVPDE